MRDLTAFGSHPVLLDSDILLYSVDALASDRPKRDQARAILNTMHVRLSTKTLEEFFQLATRSDSSRGLTPENAAQFIALWQRFPVQDMDMATFGQALMLTRAYDLSLREAQVFAAASAQECPAVLSAAIRDNTIVNGVTTINPFNADGAQVQL